MEFDPDLIVTKKGIGGLIKSGFATFPSYSTFGSGVALGLYSPKDSVNEGYVSVDPAVAGSKVLLNCNFSGNVPATIAFYDGAGSSLGVYDIYKYGSGVTAFSGVKKITIPSGTEKLTITVTKKTSSTTAQGSVSRIDIEK